MATEVRGWRSLEGVVKRHLCRMRTSFEHQKGTSITHPPLIVMRYVSKINN